MSYISDNASEVDPELRGSVDFNFFDSPKKVDTSEKMTNGGGNGDENSVVSKQHGGQADHKNDSHRLRHGRRDSRSDDDDYTDDSFSDSGSCTTGCSQRSLSGSRSRSRSRSSSPSPTRHSHRSSDSKFESKNNLDAKPDAGDLGSHHSRSRHSSYSSRSRSRSRSSSYDNNSRTRSSQYSQSKDSLKIELPDADGDNDKKKSCLKSYSGSDSDSDMTDVSPLNSREPSPSASPRQLIHGSSKDHRSHGGRPPRSPMYKEKGPRRGIGETSKIDREDIDFDLLMQAVIEMDKDRMRSDQSGKKVMFIPPHIRKKIEKNYSFANDKISDIDRENQRLLQEIMRQNQGRRKRVSANEPPRNQRMSSSAVNRRREQRRVEEENLKILNRLQQVKPSKGLSRNDQIKDYTRQVTYGVPMPMAGSLGRRPTSGYARSTSNASWDGDEGAQSLISYESSPSQKARPVSAKVRPQSGRVRPLSGKVNRPVSAKVRASQRPEWEDRW